MDRKIDITQESMFRIGKTEWALVIDGKGGLSILSRYDRCNVGGIGCDSKHVNHHSEPDGVSSLKILVWTCQP